jgi:predicted  nucleic acid-binding Zn-ribbon protein
MDMNKTEDDIQHLIQIVNKDQEIHEKKKFLENAPVRIREINKKVKVMMDELEESQSFVEKLDKERRHLEREINAQSAKIDQKKIEQRNVKTNKEFRALSTEIDYLSKLVDKEEERVLVILEEMEVKKKEINTITERIKSEKDVLLGEKRVLEDGMKRKEEDLKILEDEKVRILPHISENVRRLYDRILVKKGDSGVANLVRDICQGCYSRVPPQKAHEIRKNSQISTCEVCGRILVYFSVD